MKMPSGKITPDLRQRIEAGEPGEMLDVVLEFTSPESGTAGLSNPVERGERIAAGKREFVEIAGPVEQLVTNLGGEVTGRVWLNKTLRARLPASRIEDLTGAPGVRTVDVPHHLTSD